MPSAEDGRGNATPRVHSATNDGPRDISGQFADAFGQDDGPRYDPDGVARAATSPFVVTGSGEDVLHVWNVADDGAPSWTERVVRRAAVGRTGPP